MTKQTLREQLNKSTGFDSPHEEAYLNIMRSAALLSGPEIGLFKSLDPPLSPASYNLLRILRGHKNKGASEGVPSSTIGSQMVVRMPDVTRLVDRLERVGLARRAKCAKDKRVVYVAITDEGLAMLNSIDAKVQDLVRAQLDHMSDDELNTLSRLLERARNEEERTEHDKGSRS